MLYLCSLMQIDIRQLSQADISASLESWGEKPFRARQSMIGCGREVPAHLRK